MPDERLAAIRVVWGARLPWLLAATMIVAIFAPVIGGETFFYSDYTYIYHPLKRWTVEALSAGRLPEWNRDLALGLPHLTNPIIGALYPPHLLLLVLPLTWGLNALIVAHIGLAFALSWRLLKAVGAPPWAAALGASAFALSGPMLSSIVYVYPVLAWAWVPLAGEGALRATRAPGKAKGLPHVAAAVAMCLLAGDPLAALAAALLCLAVAASASSRRAPALGLCAAGGLLGAGLAAIQLLPALSFLGDSIRADGVAGATSGTWSLAPVRLTGLLHPAPFGRFAPEMTFWGQHLTGTLNDGNFFYLSHYLGIAPVVLLPIAAAAPATRRLTLALLAVALLGLVLSLGRWLPGYATLVEVVPGMAYFRYAEKWSMLAALCLPLAGGLGLLALSKDQSTTASRVAAMAVATLIAAGGVAVVLLDGPLRSAITHYSPVPIEDAARSIQVWGGVLVAASALACLALISRRRRPAWVVPALAVVALLDVAAGNASLVWTAPPDLMELPAATLSRLDVQGRIARHDSLDRVRLHKDLAGLVARFRRHQATLRANAVLEAGGQRVGAETPARLRHAVQPDDWLWAAPAAAAPVVGAERLLVSASRPPQAVRRAADAGALKPEAIVRPLDLAVLAPSDRPLPPVFCASPVTPASSPEEAARALLTADRPTPAVVEPNATVGPPVVPGAIEHLAKPGGPPRAWACAEQSRDPGETTAHVKLTEPALLVVRDAFAPGWSATVDGAPAGLIRAYGSLLALPLPPGEHDVELRYRTPGLALGAGLSAASLALLAAWIYRSRRSRSGRIRVCRRPRWRFCGAPRPSRS